MANLPAPAGKRPVLLLGRNAAYEYLNKLIAAAVTTTIRGIAQEVKLGRAEGMTKACVANCDTLRTIPKSLLVKRAGALAPSRHGAVKRTVAHALAWIELLEPALAN